ncbi:MAG: hypothetical protein O9289_15705 [Rhodobacteraceae bacterium]|nr:hypothetical protein [Paracoccaceae bacterium]MCZ8084642.1 hypothetical protein [Paracoccaceae bacterium]
MTAITVRAADSRKAMEELQRCLGPDALILSTRHIGGMVEITALPPNADPASLTPEPPRRDTTPEPANFAAAMQASIRRAAATDPVDHLIRHLLLPDGLAEEWPTRILIAGPPGAGKSMLAARLAARLMLAQPGARPQIIAPLPAASLVEDRLRGWCRLMGLTPDRPNIAQAMALPGPSTAMPQIIDLSDCADQAAGLAARLIETDGAELVLCLPVGLHPARIARLCHDWQAFAPTVTLTGLDQWWPERDELQAIATAGLKLTRIAAGAGLVNALSRPGPADLRNWASGWSPALAEAAE